MKQTVYIPEKLSEITLRQYQEFLKDESKAVEIFCGIDDIKNVSKKDYLFLVESISNVLNEVPGELVTRFRVNNVEYGFIPNLDNITLGEFIDLDDSLGDNTQLLRSMSVLYRPITKTIADKYDIEPYTAVINNELLDMPLDAVLSSNVFFWNLGRQLLENTQNFLDNHNQEIANEPRLQNLLTKNGVGISALKSSLVETSQELMKLLTKSLLPVYTILPTSKKKEKQK